MDLVVAGRKQVCAVTDKGRAIVELVDRWAIEWTDEKGRTRHQTVGKDKRAATAALAKREEQAARLRHGLPDHAADAKARGRPLVEVIGEYLETLAGADTSPGYRQHTRSRLLAIQEGCGWGTWLDVTSDKLVRFLGRLRDQQHRSLATLNGYIRAAKGFANWQADKLGDRSPLKGVGFYPAQKDRRRSRRILTDDEFDKLLLAAANAPRRYGCLVPPRDRVILYQIAAYSGLRASELARLTVKSVELGTEPGLTVYGKGKREEFTPIPRHLAEVLRPWLAGKKPTQKLFPGPWATNKHQVKWIRGDAKRAGLGEGVTFHSLRRRYVTALLRAGNAVDVVRRMARHKDLQTTMSYYAEIVPADLKAAAESLKPPRAG